jgi:predicted ATPase
VGTADGEEYDNLADVGFGFSQLLPLVAQIHSYRRRARRGIRAEARQQIIAIEQPELHLHPAFQAKLADLFARAIAPNEGVAPTIILESHSEALIARLGELVVEGKLNPADVILHFVEKDDKAGLSTVRVGQFAPDGSIDNWPVGFFSSRQ